MSEGVETKRQNFNVTPEQEAQIEHLRDVLGASSAKDAILRAVSLTVKLREYLNKGYHIELIKDDKRSELLIPDLEPSVSRSWKYLVERPHSWRRQLYVKGRRLLAFTVWQDMQLDDLTLEETATNFSLPVEAVAEAIRYCEQNRPLLEMESQEEYSRLNVQGVDIQPSPTR